MVVVEYQQHSTIEAEEVAREVAAVEVAVQFGWAQTSEWESEESEEHHGLKKQKALWGWEQHQAETGLLVEGKVVQVAH